MIQLMKSVEYNFTEHFPNFYEFLKLFVMMRSLSSNASDNVVNNNFGISIKTFFIYDSKKHRLIITLKFKKQMYTIFRLLNSY